MSDQPKKQEEPAKDAPAKNDPAKKKPAKEKAAKEKAAADKPADSPAPPAHAADPTKTHLVRTWSYKSPMLGCRIDPQGRFLVTTAQDFNVLRYSLAGEELVTLQGHESWLRGMAFLDDGQTLVTAGYDHQLIFWPLADEQPEPRQRIANAHHGWVRSIAVSPDGKLLATAGNDCLVKLWTADGKPVREMAGHERHVYNVAFHPDGKQLASFDLMGRIKHWDVATGKEQRQIEVASLHNYDKTFRADIGGARCLAFTADGKQLACGGITGVTNAFAGVGNAAVAVIDWATGEQQHLLQPKKPTRGTMWGMAIHPAGLLLGACGGNGGHLFCWRLADGEVLHEMKLPSDARDLCLHPDEMQLAIVSFDQKARLYKLAEKEPVPEEKDKAAKDKAAKDKAAKDKAADAKKS